MVVKVYVDKASKQALRDDIISLGSTFSKDRSKPVSKNILLTFHVVCSKYNSHTRSVLMSYLYNDLVMLVNGYVALDTFDIDVKYGMRLEPDVFNAGAMYDRHIVSTHIPHSYHVWTGLDGTEELYRVRLLSGHIWHSASSGLSSIFCSSFAQHHYGYAIKNTRGRDVTWRGNYGHIYHDDPPVICVNDKTKYVILYIALYITSSLLKEKS